MRLADQEECRALGLDPYTALAVSRERSEETYEIWRDGMLLAEWGWRTDSFLLGTASVWMLSFDPIEKRKIFAARESKRLLECLLCNYKTLRCEVHARYELSIKWLAWLGFKVEAIVHVGPETFYVMKIERADAWER